MIADIGSAGIGEETVELRCLAERIDAGQGMKEEPLGLIRGEAERVEIDSVSADMRSQIDDVFFIGDDVEESVLPEDAQPERRLSLLVLSAHLDGDSDMPAISTVERNERVGWATDRGEWLDEEINAAYVMEIDSLIVVLFDNRRVGRIAETADMMDEDCVPLLFDGGMEGDLGCPVSIVARFLEQDVDEGAEESAAENKEKRHNNLDKYLLQYIRKQP